MPYTVRYMNTHQPLPENDVRRLLAITTKGTHSAREIMRAQTLLFVHEGKRTSEIAERVRRSVRTVRRIHARYTEGGLDRALYDAPRSGQPKKTNDADDAYLVALACTDAPEGSACWTLELLSDRFMKERHKSLCRTAIWVRLTQRGIKPWVEKNVVHPEHHAGV